jgi:iron complex transport system ATP-binding protein
MSQVELKNIGFSIEKHSILNSVSAVFKEKTLTCILGPNGAGKTTLIQSICRLIDYSGEITIDGQSIQSLSSQDLARQVSYVPQSISSDISFTVEEFILLSRYPWQWLSQLDQQKMDDIIEITGLKNHLKQTMNTLSGGERQRALIAAALIQDTPVILLDEITSALDPCYQEQMVNLLIEIRNTGKTLLWTTHDLTAALLYSDSILTLKDGQVFATGTAEELIESGTFNKLYDRKFEVLQHPSLPKKILI